MTEFNVGAIRYQQTEPTMFLRWIDGVLHQGWAITEFEGASPVSRKVEYRPVPSEVTEGRSDA